MSDVCLWLLPPWLDLDFSIALTVVELRAIVFVSSQYVYFDCLPVMIHWIHLSKGAFTRAFFLLVLHATCTAESRAKIGRKNNLSPQ